MSRSEPRRFRRPNEISNIPLASPRGTKRRIDDGSRRRGVVQSGHRTKITGRRRRAAAWRGLGAVAIVIAVVVAASFVWLGFRTVSVERSLGKGMVDPGALKKVVRESIPAEGPFTIAVITTRDGGMEAASILGVDPVAKRAYLQSVPANTSVPMQKGVVRLGDSFKEGGPAQSVAALESVIGTEVAGYVEIDAQRAPELASGWTTPSADAELGARQRAVVLPIMRTLAETQDSFGLLALGRQAPGVLKTTLGARDLTQLASVLGTIDLAKVRSEEMVSTERNGIVVPDAASTRAQARDLAAGKATVAKARKVKPSTVTVEIRNGIGVTGVAADAARRLTSAGYKVGDVGNAGQFVYKETLVIFKEGEAAARQVAKELPVGRVVESRGMYAFKDDVLVIVGKDWLDPR